MPGCGPAGTEERASELPSQGQGLQVDNGLSLNGLSLNGLSLNGLSLNGLSLNGLSLNGLSAPEFTAWFTQDPSHADMVVTYLVKCAVPAGESRSYTDPQTGQRYVWNGELGLAPSWAHGSPSKVDEQQVISACLAAHTNQHALHIPISILGRGAQGPRIPYTDPELATFSVREACFFGNLFTQEGIFFAADRAGAPLATRACGVLSHSTECAPLTLVGSCEQFCKQDGKRPFYKECTYGGVTYRPIATRMRPQDYEQLFLSAAGD
jgi:hypothetical protein